ncbi:MAG TPA: hypothetical protein VGM88_32435 [Kofleriaceae bacterium]
MTASLELSPDSLITALVPGPAILMPPRAPSPPHAPSPSHAPSPPPRASALPHAPSPRVAPSPPGAPSSPHLAAPLPRARHAMCPSCRRTRVMLGFALAAVYGFVVALVAITLASPSVASAAPAAGAAGSASSAASAGSAGSAAVGEGGVVALLPLDADASLEIYGQPVASELARALVAGGVEVVVVGPKMAVPDRAQLIVDGTIKVTGPRGAGNDGPVTLSVRVRNRADGSIVTAPLTADAKSLANIDRAAADVSARLLPAVRDRIAALHAAEHPAPHVAAGSGSAAPAAPVAPVAHVRPAIPLVFTVSANTMGTAPLQSPLTAAVAALPSASHRLHVAPAHVDAASIAPVSLAKTLSSTHAPYALSLDVVAYEMTPGAIPSARARVHAKLYDHDHTYFDRTLVTDTIVGDRGQDGSALAARVAHEVIAILAPQLARSEARLE